MAFEAVPNAGGFQPAPALRARRLRSLLDIRPRISGNGLLLMAVAYLVTTQNLSFWRRVLSTLPADLGFGEILFLGSLYLLLVAMMVVALAPFSLRPVIRPMLSLLLMLAAVCSYFMDQFSVVIDAAMIRNAFQTDVQESSELLVPQLFLHVLIAAGLPGLFLWRVELAAARPARELLQRIILVGISLMVLTGVGLAQYKNLALWARQHREVRMYFNPSYALYSAVQYFRTAHAPLRPLQRIGADAALPAVFQRRPRLVILVVGETARAASFQLDGYARDTNPELTQIKDLYSFRQVAPCGTSTAISVPCMFFRGGRQAFSEDAALHQENLLDVVQRAGARVLWRDNNSGCKGVCERVANEEMSSANDPELCGDGSCFDAILLKDFDRLLAADRRDQFIVLHQKGSHGPAYYRRRPPAFRRFAPECTLEDIRRCTREQIVNAYDNTIVYTDHFLAELIRLLRSHADINSALVYVSDHGESLGENGLYLHGLPYSLAPDEQKRVPMLLWLSESFRQQQHLDPRCILDKANAPLSHDNLFDTVLGLMAVRTDIYDPERDMLQACRVPT